MRRVPYPDSGADVERREGAVMSRRRIILLLVAFLGLLIVITAALLIRYLSAPGRHTAEIQVQPLGSLQQAELGIEPVTQPKVRGGSGSAPERPAWRDPATPGALPCRRRSC
jgi:hypothetical protein